MEFVERRSPTATPPVPADVWVWGATGEVGSRIAARLAQAATPALLLGRSHARLAALGRQIPEPQTAVLTADGLVPALRSAAADGVAPRVLVHTVGPFDPTAGELVRTCLELGIDYVDISNEEASVGAVLARDAEARAVGRRLVTGAGYGVAATECLVLTLMDGREPAREVLVAGAPHLETLGPAVTRSALETVATGGRRYAGGRLVRSRLGRPVVEIPHPDGTTTRMGPVPTGDLHAAQRASGADEVLMVSTEMPTSWLLTPVLGVVGSVLARPRVRAAALRAADRLRLSGPSAGDDDPEVSRSYARVVWADGRTREGWLELGPSYAFTAAILADVVQALLGGASPGAFTPGALLGARLPLAHGGRYLGLEERLP